MKRIMILALALCFSVAIRAEETLTFGVVPQQSAAKLARLWAPLLQEVSQRSGVKLAFRTAPDIPTFEQRLAAGEYDVAYMNPYHYTVYSKNPGYRAIAKVKDKRIKGIVVVHKDSPVTDITQLQGEMMAFPAPAAFAATVLPRANFEKRGITITPKYVGSHDSVYLSVARGLYPVGGGVIRTFNNVDKSLRDRLRILWTTDGYTPHAFAVHPRVEEMKLQRVVEAMLSLGNDEQGLALLGALRFKPLESASDSDWDDVRALGIQLINGAADQ